MSVVGFAEGLDDGFEEGVKEGLTEGSDVGSLEGTDEGIREGAFVGEEGANVGCLDGADEGLKEGSYDGFDEGSNDGSTDGATDGAAEGAQLYKTGELENVIDEISTLAYVFALRPFKTPTSNAVMLMNLYCFAQLYVTLNGQAAVGSQGLV